MLFRTHIWTRAAYEITSWLWFGNNCNRGSEGKSRCQQKNRKQILLGPMFCGAIHADRPPLWRLWLHNNIIWLHVMLPTDRSHNSFGPWRALFLECVKICWVFFFPLLKASHCRPISSIDPQLRRLIKTTTCVRCSQRRLEYI